MIMMMMIGVNIYSLIQFERRMRTQWLNSSFFQRSTSGHNDRQVDVQVEFEGNIERDMYKVLDHHQLVLDGQRALVGNGQHQLIHARLSLHHRLTLHRVVVFFNAVMTIFGQEDASFVQGGTWRQLRAGLVDDRHIQTNRFTRGPSFAR